MIPVRILRDTADAAEHSAWAPYGSGGVWRRRQIDGILCRHGLQAVSLEPVGHRSFVRKVMAVARAKAGSGAAVPWRRTSLSAAGYSHDFYSRNISRPDVARLVLLEWATDPVAISAVKRAGGRVVADLVGIGGLWRDRPHPISGPYPGMLLTEIENLRKADAVFCISREEQWLLRNLDVAAQYLPYFPDHERESALLAERQGRVAVHDGRPEFLICATRGNSDSVASFREQAAWIVATIASSEAVFHVTGHQTEQIREIWADPRFVFHGTCPDAEFVDVKRRCRAICMHSRQGIGAVTRIPDMLLAGLAVVASAAAARSFLGTQGVSVYDTALELGDLLRRRPADVSPPQRPIALEDEFAAGVRSLL